MARLTVVRRFLLLALSFYSASCTELGGADAISLIVVNPGRDTIAPGSSLQLTAELISTNGRSLTGRSVTWQSSQPTVASVSSTGLVTAAATGWVTIRAKSEGRTGASDILVREPVVAMRLEPSAATIDVRDGFFKPRVDLQDQFGNPAYDREVSW